MNFLHHFIALLTIVSGMACLMSASPAPKEQQWWNDWAGAVAGVVFLICLSICFGYVALQILFKILGMV